MLETDFAQRYRAMQEEEHAPAGLVEATRELCNATSGDKVHRRKCRWVAPVAACLAALVALFGVGATLLNPASPFNQPQARAYAKTPNLLTAELGDGVVPFALDGHTAFQGWGSDQARDALGCFTGIQFTMEGENIARVQATISRGELYQLTTETYDRTTEEGEAILKEAAFWKPSARGTGKYLGDYDWVTVYMMPSDLDKTDPQRKEQLRLIKRIGSTIDMPYEGEPLTFGLWFDSVEYLENGLPDMSSLDGIELTITAQYDDGTFRTQKMILHDGWFTTSATNTDQGADSVMAEGPFPTQPKNSIDRTPYYNPVHTLYGEVVAITDQPHPYSLENANVRADEAPVPYRLEDELPSYGSTLTVDALPSDDRIYAASDSVMAGEWNFEQNGWTEVRWGGFSACVADELPPFIAPYEGREVIAFGENYEYLSRVRLKTNGWSINKQGELNAGNSFVLVDVDVTNDRDESVKIGTEYAGAICAIDRDAGTTTFATPGVFAAKDNKARLWTRGTELWIEAGETVHLQVAFIVDDAVAETDDVCYALGTFSNLIRGELDGELDSLKFISLGKLERK